MRFLYVAGAVLALTGCAQLRGASPQNQNMFANPCAPMAKVRLQTINTAMARADLAPTSTVSLAIGPDATPHSCVEGPGGKVTCTEAPVAGGAQSLSQTLAAERQEVLREIYTACETPR